MPTFEYQALTSAGRLMKGTVEAESRDEARQTLAAMQLTVNQIEPAPAAGPRTPVGRSEFLLFNQQLAAIARAGIPLERSLRELAGDVTSRSMRRLIQAVADDLEAGEGIEQAFEKRRKHFPPLYGRLIAAGVASGRLGEMLTSLNRHLELSGATRRAVFEAACYPAVVLALAAAVVTALFVFVVPLFKPLFDGLYMTPPAATRLVFAVSDNVGWIWLGLAVVAAAAVAAKVLLGEFPAGRRAKETMLMNVPALGRIHRSSALSRLADAMALLVGAGADMPTCLRLGADASGSERLAQECDALARYVEAGQSLWQGRDACKVIPRLFLYSLEWGSHRGELADNLYSLSEMHARQAAANQARLRAVLSPVLLLLVGGLVALMVLAMFVPLTKTIIEMPRLITTFQT